MSLFGDSPPPSRQAKSSLFDEEPASKSGSGLFADEGTGNSGSPWDFPSPKKSARKNLVKSLLQGSDVPDSYVDAYDNLLETGATAEGGISIAAARKLVAESKIGQGEQDKIFEIVGASPDGLGRSEFNVLLALIGLAQEGEELSLDAVDERRQSTSDSCLAIPLAASQWTRISIKLTSTQDYLLHLFLHLEPESRNLSQRPLRRLQGLRNPLEAHHHRRRAT